MTIDVEYLNKLPFRTLKVRSGGCVPYTHRHIIRIPNKDLQIFFCTYNSIEKLIINYKDKYNIFEDYLIPLFGIEDLDRNAVDYTDYNLYKKEWSKLRCGTRYKKVPIDQLIEYLKSIFGENPVNSI